MSLLMPRGPHWVVNTWDPAVTCEETDTPKWVPVDKADVADGAVRVRVRHLHRSERRRAEVDDVNARLEVFFECGVLEVDGWPGGKDAWGEEAGDPLFISLIAYIAAETDPITRRLNALATKERPEGASKSDSADDTG